VDSGGYCEAAGIGEQEREGGDRFRNSRCPARLSYDVDLLARRHSQAFRGGPRLNDSLTDGEAPYVKMGSAGIDNPKAESAEWNRPKYALAIHIVDK
jgi:hypothetical protein